MVPLWKWNAVTVFVNLAGYGLSCTYTHDPFSPIVDVTLNVTLTPTLDVTLYVTLDVTLDAPSTLDPRRNPRRIDAAGRCCHGSTPRRSTLDVPSTPRRRPLDPRRPGLKRQHPLHPL